MSDATTNNTNVTAEWIRRPLADLGGLSPADAAADPAARRKVEDLLTELAGHHVRLSNLGLPAVNPADIRKALGLEAHAHAAPHRAPARVVRAGPVKRNSLLDELGTALTGGDVDSVSFYNTKSHAVEHFMHNLGDVENVRIAEAEGNAEFKKITPVTTEVRYGIMSDFISLIEDINVAGRLRTAISGKGAFRRFRETVDEEDTLRRRWLGYRTKRHYHLALDWLHKHEQKPEGLNPADYDWEPQREPSKSEAPKAEAKEAKEKPVEAPVGEEIKAETPAEAPAETQAEAPEGTLEEAPAETEAETPAETPA
jgi:Uncharacterised protein family (UPF0158)/Protein of unknown function (DUF2384)